MANLSWSDETYTIRQLASKEAFPIVVRVNEGYLPEDGNEAEGFSQGDLIKLDFQKSYQKVAARFLDGIPRLDTEGYVHPGGDLLIPLGYRGKLRVIHTNRTFRSIQEIKNEFPRFIRVDKSISASKGPKKEKVVLPKNTELELDRFLPNEGLVCRCSDKTVVVLDLHQSGYFTMLPDSTHYTLKEVIDRFQLPQNVQFIDIDFQAMATDDLDNAIENIKRFKGCLKLMRVVRQEVVVGHYKPLEDTANTRSGNFCRRAVALLPLDSEIVNEIEVQIPVYSEPDDYEFLMAKNFSGSVNMEEIEGGLYLEFSNIPRIHKFERNDFEKDVPPPRPPKPGQGSVKPKQPEKTRIRRRNPPPLPASSPQSNEDDESPTDEYEEIKEVVQPPHRKHGSSEPKPTAVTRPTVQKPKNDENDVYEIKEEDDALKEKLGIGKAPSTFKLGLKKVHHELKKNYLEIVKRMGRSHSSVSLRPTQPPSKRLPSKSELIDHESDDSDLDEYDYPDITEMKKCEIQTAQKQKQNFRSPKTSQPTNKPKPEEKITRAINKSKPVAQVTPLSSQSSNASDRKPFDKMTVEEVVTCFRQYSLPSMAAKCEAEKIDGAFIAMYSKTQIQKMFGLSELQVQKVEMMKSGWRPKRDN